MMSDCCVRIEKFTNGYTVEIKDPAIVKANNRPYDAKKPNSSSRYREPWKSFVFKTDAEVVEFLRKNLKKAIASSDDDDDEYGTAFDTALKSEAD
jgi:hypothetical protein